MPGHRHSGAVTAQHEHRTGTCSGGLFGRDEGGVVIDDPDRVHHNFVSVYTIATDGESRPTMVNLTESDAKRLTGATFRRWS